MIKTYGKKMLAIVIAVLMVVSTSIFAVTAADYGPNDFVIQPEYTVDGSTVTLVVKVIQNPAIFGFTLNIGYNKDVFNTLTTSDSVVGFTAMPITMNNPTSDVGAVMIFESNDLTNGFTETGTLVTMTFTLKDASTTPDSFNFSALFRDTSDMNGDSFPYTILPVKAAGGEETTYKVTVNGTALDTEYAEGATVTVTATVGAEEVFGGWVSNDVSVADTTATTTTFTMPAKDVALTYQNTTKTYTVTVNGTALETKYAAGTTVSVTATVGAEEVFGGWVSSDVSVADTTVANTTFTMPAKDVALTYQNTTKTYTVTVNGTALETKYAAGATVSVTATVGAEEVFGGWVSSDVSVADTAAATTTFTMPSKDVALTYQNTTKTYALYINGTKQGDYTKGETVNITATVDEGQVFDVWNPVEGVAFGNASSASTTITMPGSITYLTYVTKGVTTYNVTVNGTSIGSYAEGATVNITGTVGEHQKFVTWDAVEGISYTDATAATTTFTMPATDVALTYTVATAHEVTVAGTSIGYFYEGDTVNITGEPKDGYDFVEWNSTSNISFDSSTSATTSFVMIAEDVEVTFTEEAKTFKVYVNDVQYMTAKTDSSVSVTANLDAGYKVKWSSADITIATDDATQLTFNMPAKDVYLKKIAYMPYNVYEKDSVINAKDVLMLRRILAGVVTNITDSSFLAADQAESYYTLNAKDLLALRLYIVGAKSEDDVIVVGATTTDTGSVSKPQ